MEMPNLSNISMSPLEKAERKSQKPCLEKIGRVSTKTASTCNSQPISPFQTEGPEEGLFDFCDLLEYVPMPEFQQIKCISDKESENILSQSKKIKKERVQCPSTKNSIPSKSAPAKKDAWRPDEDAQLISLHAKYGPKWAQIASVMENRTGKQIRDRYLNMLRPDINHDDWTPEEEKLFAELCEQYGNKWCKIASFLPGRTENQVKNKYYWERKRKSPVPVKKNTKKNIPRNSATSCEIQQSVEVQSALVDETVETTMVVEVTEEFFQFESEAAIFDDSYQIFGDNFRELNWKPF